MRENIRLMLKNNQCDILNQYQSLIFIAKNGAIDKDFKEIQKSILTLLDKIANKNL